MNPIPRRSTVIEKAQLENSEEMDFHKVKCQCHHTSRLTGASPGVFEEPHSTDLSTLTGPNIVLGSCIADSCLPLGCWCEFWELGYCASWKGDRGAGREAPHSTQQRTLESHCGPDESDAAGISFSSVWQSCALPITLPVPYSAARRTRRLPGRQRTVEPNLIICKSQTHQRPSCQGTFIIMVIRSCRMKVSSSSVETASKGGSFLQP